MIFYPRHFPVAGFTPFPWLMFIKKKYKDDISLLKHEQTHQQQMREDWTIVFWMRYLFSRNWRMHYEVEAYKVQMANGASLNSCAYNLSKLYFLSITFEQAKELLS